MSNSLVPSYFPWSALGKPESPRQSLSFMGYHRPDGTVGTRNYWLVIPLVAVDREQLALFQEAFQTVLGYQCPNSYERQLRDLREQYRAGSYFNAASFASVKPVPKPLFSNIDGIKFLPVYEDSPGTASEMDPFLDSLAEYCTHANVGGVTVLSGGEPDDTVQAFCQLIDQCAPALNKPMLVIDRATYTSDSDWLRAATQDTFRAMALLNKQTRQSAPLSRLIIGTQQGTTNEPFINQVVDECLQLVASVGATVLITKPKRGPSNDSIQPVNLSGNEIDLLTVLSTAGCTLQLTPPGPDLPSGNALTPVIPLAFDNDLTMLTQPGESLLRYLIKLASGELRTPSESGGVG